MLLYRRHAGEPKHFFLLAFALLYNYMLHEHTRGSQAGLVGSVYLGHLALSDHAISTPPLPPTKAGVTA